MRYILIILLFISLNLSAQSDKYKVIGMSILETVADATGDALMDSGNKELGYIMQGATIALFVIEPALIEYNSFRDVSIKAVSLIAARVLLFNVTYNVVSGLPYDYIGSTSYYDKFCSSQPDKFRFGKGIIITIGFAITINEWDKFK